MIKLSQEQAEIVNAPLAPMSVVACAGSGKTKTAVSRLAKIRKELGSCRERVALLSFSNIAVKTFRSDYSKYVQEREHCGSYEKVTIETLDGFITSNILRPHAYRTMGCSNTPFLLSGTESFLQNAKFKFERLKEDGTKIPVQAKEIANITYRKINGKSDFYCNSRNNLYKIVNGLKVTNELGKIGAYSHELGKFWACKTLVEQKNILKVLASRYPHIIIDEAQDIDYLHQVFLEMLAKAGVKITLIGDPSQAIYDFAGADGSFLKEFHTNDEYISKELTKNFRSIPNILNIANTLSKRDDKADRKQVNEQYGAFYAVYEPSKTNHLLDIFQKAVENSGQNISEAVVLSRSNSIVNRIKGTGSKIGQGKTALLAQAAICRDQNSDFLRAFKLVTNCVVGLLVNPPDNLAVMISNPDFNSDYKELKRDIWKFVRSEKTGLPSALLNAREEWHGLLKKRMNILLRLIENKYSFEPQKDLGRKLNCKDLPASQLVRDPELLDVKVRVRVDTVHQAKGESLDSVLYVATKEHIKAMLEGVDSELGRIGYVAVTRARNLFVLGVPKNSVIELKEGLHSIGLKELKK